MTVEIERKFLVGSMPPAARLGLGVGLRQGYLAVEEDVEVRLRVTDDRATVRATLTVKAGSGLSRTEVDAPIPVAEADSLWPHTAGKRVEKTRHRVVLGDARGLVAEVDIYTGALEGLCVVEVEFASELAAHEFEVPTWFGREVTGEVGWSNAALARRGRPG